MSAGLVITINLIQHRLVLAVTPCIGCLVFAIAKVSGPNDPSSLWDLGCGEVNLKALFKGQTIFRPTSLIGNYFAVNIPQPVFSFIYFLYNGTITAMFGEREWNQFGRKRKALRVSHSPSGSQRSTYFLQLPYRFAIPLLVFSGFIHWLISQSVFLVAVESYRSGKYVAEELTAGYSPLGIFSVMVLSIVMIWFLHGLGIRRYPARIPLARNCSLVISAACHPRRGGGGSASEEMHLHALQWGVTSGGNAVQAGHCTFSTSRVSYSVPN